MTRRAFLTFIVILLLTIGLLPVLSMLIKSVMVDGRFSLASYEGLLTSARQWRLMGHSMALSSLVTALTTLVGVPLGILLGKTDLPFRRFFAVLFVLPLLIPPYIIAVSWFNLLGRDGLLAHMLGATVAGWTSVGHPAFSSASRVVLLSCSLSSCRSRCSSPWSSCGRSTRGWKRPGDWFRRGAG